MKQMIALGLAATVLLLACKKLNDDLTPEINSKSNSNEKAPYIVVLKSLSKELGQRTATITARRNANRSNLEKEGLRNLKKMMQQDLADVADVLVHDFASIGLQKKDLIFSHFGTLNTYSAWLTEAQATQLRKDPQVQSVGLTGNVTTADVPSAGSELFAPNAAGLSNLTFNGVSNPSELWVGLDPDFPTQFRSPYNQEIRDWSINAVGGLVDGTQSTTAQVWVFDSGIDTAHADLQYRGSRSLNYVLLTSQGGQYNGSFEQDSYVDNNGHGSHVAGIIAAKRGNGIGTWGLANLPVNVVKVVEENGSGSATGWIGNSFNALITLKDFGVLKSGDIVNMSFGAGAVFPQVDSLVRLLADQGVKFVISAGNASTTASNVSPASAGLPSTTASKNATFRAPNGTSFTHYKNIYVVSAIDWNREFAGSYSNRGNVITIAAPGTRILSASRYGRYAIKTGTSMAAPIVTALLLNANGALYVPANNFVSKIWRPGQVGDPPSITGPLVTNDPDTRRDCIIKKRSAYASMANQTFKAED
jgi:Subtilase family